jgi:membrane-associated protease RseP (regulator of RpoE activity)
MSFPISSRKAIVTGQNYPLHTFLFLVTVITTLWAGASWSGHPVLFSPAFPFLNNLSSGTAYSFSLLLFLSVHEFGHFFAALYHRVHATLPYYIPLPPLPSLLSLGTMGAVIKIRDRIPGTNALFDIGIAGPISGFIVSVGLLLFGFMTLPPAEFIYTIHPEYQSSGGLLTLEPEGSLTLGKNLLWIILEKSIAPKNLPPMTEMYHYPFLFTGWLGSLVTALNLLPVGQLDGGHVIYAMFGKKGHTMAAKSFLIFITILGLPSLFELLLVLFKPASVSLIPELLRQWSWPGWLLWALILSRFIGLNHPPTGHDHPLSTPRKVFGWAAITIFVLTFTPVPFGLT